MNYQGKNKLVLEFIKKIHHLIQENQGKRKNKNKKKKIRDRQIQNSSEKSSDDEFISKRSDSDATTDSENSKY